MNKLATTETSNISIKLNSASQALAEATSDFERIVIRDAARKLQADKLRYSTGGIYRYGQLF